MVVTSSNHQEKEANQMSSETWKLNFAANLVLESIRAREPGVQQWSQQKLTKCMDDDELDEHVVWIKEDFLLNHFPEPWPPHWPRSLTTPVPITCCWMCLLDHPSARSHHLSTTRQTCGPGDRPYPPRPRSHLATHIVRFVTHLARKSISELLHRKDSFSLYDCSNTRVF